MYKIRNSLLNPEKMSYVKEGVNYDIQLNCNEGINPYGFNEDIIKDRSFPYDMWKEYHMPLRLKDRIVEYWAPTTDISTKNIFLSNGSINSLYTISNIFLSENPKVLGVKPQFSEFVTNLKALGYEYEGITLNRENNYELNVDSLIDMISMDHSLIYLDNPNNPTGQFLSVEQIERIVKRAKELGVFLLVDEAFADYMDITESAANLINEYENLIVARTFSKGLGMAGSRVGYSLCSPEIVEAMAMLQDPYIFPEYLEIISIDILDNYEYLKAAIEKIKKTKTMVVENIGNNLKIAVTEMKVPISMVYHVDHNVDLAHEFGIRGISVISGSDFYGLDKSCIRLRVPRLEDSELLISVLKEINENQG